MSPQPFPLRRWAVVLVSICLFSNPHAALGSRERGVRRRSREDATAHEKLAARSSWSTPSDRNVHTRQYPMAMTLRTVEKPHDESLSSKHTEGAPGTKSQTLPSKKTAITPKTMIRTTNGESESIERNLFFLDGLNSREGSFEWARKKDKEEKPDGVLEAAEAPEESNQKDKDKDDGVGAAEDEVDDLMDVMTNVTGANATLPPDDLLPIDMEDIEVEELEGEFIFEDEDDDEDDDGGKEDKEDKEDSKEDVEETEEPTFAPTVEPTFEPTVQEVAVNAEEKDDKDNGKEEEEEVVESAVDAEEEDKGGKDKDDEDEDDVDLVDFDETLMIDDMTNVTATNMTNATMEVFDDMDENLTEQIGNEGEDMDDESQSEAVLGAEAADTDAPTNTDDYFTIPTRDPDLVLVEPSACIELKNAYIYMSNFESNEAACMENPDSCSGGCCRLDTYIRCDESNEEADLQCICNFNTGS